MDIAAWLSGLGLGQYEATFRDNGVDASVLPELTADDLKEMGIAAVGHRRKLLAAIAALRGSTTSAVHSADPASEVPSTGAPPAAAGTSHGSDGHGAERRQLTVLFCDLAGSTALSARLDPEDLREVMAAYHRAVVESVRRQGGHVAKLLGDGALAYFGWPEAHEDDAERAVRAGLAAVEAVAGLRTAAGPLAARVGIATGSVVVGEVLGEGEARERGVLGETPNLAARLQALAEPGAVVVGPSTRALLGDLFEWRDLGAAELRGLAEPVRAWQVLRPSAVASRFEALHAAATLTPLVGRQDELGLLQRRWRRARAGEGQVVLLSGEPGIGKSRLAAAWQQRLEGEPHLRMRQFCSPQHSGSALFPVIGRLERAAGFAREDTAEAKGRKLRALLERTATVPRDVALLAELLLLPADPDLLAPLSPQRRREETLAAVLRQLEALARQRPVLMVFEDAHWIDPTSRELLDLAVERVQRLHVLLLVTFRPEFRPPWVGQPHVTLLSIGRLGSRDGAALVRRVATAALPAAMAKEIVERADGVPLFLEELTRAVLEAGAGSGRAALAAVPRPSVPVPATLHASLMARLDRLGPAKQVAQVGAAIGREFPYELLAAVAPLPEAELRDGLERLAASGLVHQRGAPPEASYSFKHALVQDAAYGTLLRDRRRELHARTAAVLEERFPDLAEQQPELLAHHCAEAGLLDLAITHRHKAGRRAMARSAMAEAVAQFTQALDLLAGLPVGPGRDRQEFDLQVALGSALVALKGFSAADVRKAYERARELSKRMAAPSQLLAVLSGLYAYHLHASSVDSALEIAEELLCSAKRQRDVAAQVASHRCLGSGLLFRGWLSRALEQFELTLALYGGVDHTSAAFLWTSDIRVGCLNFVPLVLQLQGYPDRALERSLEGLTAVEKLGHAYTMSHVLHLNCWLHQIRDDHKVVRERAGAMMSLSAEHGFSNWFSAAKLFHGWASAAGEETEGVAAGIAEMRVGLGAHHARGHLLQVPHFLGLLAVGLTRAGEPTEALGLIDEALMRLDRSKERWIEAELHRLRGKLLLAVPDMDAAPEAEACFRRALVVAQRQGAKWWELRAATSLARLWRDQGRRAEARDLLAPVHGWFTEGFGLPDLVEARALLEELGAASGANASTSAGR